MKTEKLTYSRVKLTKNGRGSRGFVPVDTRSRSRHGAKVLRQVLSMIDTHDITLETYYGIDGHEYMNATLVPK